VAVDHDVDVLADRLAHGGHAALRLPQRGEALDGHGGGHGHRLERGEARLDHGLRALGEVGLVAGLVEGEHLALAEVPVEAHVIAHRAAPQAVAGDAVHLAEDVPEREVDARDGRRAHDAGAVPEVAAVHELPEVLDAGGVLAEHERREVLDGADDGPRVPLEGRLAPAPEAVLVGAYAHEDPVAHAGVADVRLDGGDLHARQHAAGRPPSSTGTLPAMAGPEFWIWSDYI
jgi:hypothetical protein